MAGNRTLTMIKPDAVRAGNIGNILAHINKGGFKIVAMKLTRFQRTCLRSTYQKTVITLSLNRIWQPAVCLSSFFNDFSLRTKTGNFRVAGRVSTLKVAW